MEIELYNTIKRCVDILWWKINCFRCLEKQDAVQETYILLIQNEVFCDKYNKTENKGAFVYGCCKYKMYDLLDKWNYRHKNLKLFLDNENYDYILNNIEQENQPIENEVNKENRYKVFDSYIDKYKNNNAMISYLLKPRRIKKCIKSKAN